jgi:hypothetical protein
VSGAHDLRRFRVPLSAKWLPELLALIALVVWCLRLLDQQGFRAFDDSGWRWWGLFQALSPAALVYFTLRVVCGPGLALIVTGVVSGALNAAHQRKVAVTFEPLLYSDLASIENLAVAKEYISAGAWFLLLLGAGVLLWVGWLLYRREPRGWRRRCLYGGLAVMLAPLVFHLQVGDFDTPEWPIGRSIQRLGTVYHSWDADHNVRQNGLYMHLVHTSWADLPEPESDDDAKFARLLAPDLKPAAISGNVVYILCESCWFDRTHFREVYQPLFERGFVDFRAESPSYGGGTVNASFEMLTGLPANAALKGIIYQEYAERISSQAHALPRALQAQALPSYAMHNFRASFWRRDVINPLLGFSRFDGLSAMRYMGGEYFPPDAVLYTAALRQMQKTPQAFYFLSTVHNHGPYGDGSDSQEPEYRKKITRSVDDLVAFVDALKQRDPNALIMVFGDHKPALPRYFHTQGIFPDSFFSATGSVNADYVFSGHADPAVLGDVPVLMWHAQTDKLIDVARKADGKTFFCVSKILNDAYLGAHLPAFRFSDDWCQQDLSSRELRDAYPEWLFYFSLFQ